MSATAPVTINAVLSWGRNATLSTVAGSTSAGVTTGESIAAHLTEEFSLTTTLTNYPTDLLRLSDAIFNLAQSQLSALGATPVMQLHYEVRISDDVTTGVPGVLAPEAVYDGTLGPVELATRALVTTALTNAVVAARAQTNY